MLVFLPSSFKGICTLLMMSLSTVFWCGLLYLAGLTRWLLPASLKPHLTRIMSGIADCWIICNNLFLDLFQRFDINIEYSAQTSRERWYLVVCNHQTWADILILQRVLLQRLPMLKFFIKYQLLWVPVIGVAWWALDFPVMKRYSNQQLKDHPEWRGKDLATTRQACELFKTAPVAVLNFLEGTRFTPQKQQSQGSAFRHLLKPRSGGAALVLNVMQEQLHSLVDVTISYSQGAPGFWEFLCGKTGPVRIMVNERPIPNDLLVGDYEHDAQFQARFQAWINDLWLQKDQWIEDHRADV